MLTPRGVNCKADGTATAFGSSALETSVVWSKAGTQKAHQRCSPCPVLHNDGRHVGLFFAAWMMHVAMSSSVPPLEPFCHVALGHSLTDIWLLMCRAPTRVCHAALSPLNRPSLGSPTFQGVERALFKNPRQTTPKESGSLRDDPTAVATVFLKQCVQRETALLNSRAVICSTQLT